MCLALLEFNNYTNNSINTNVHIFSKIQDIISKLDPETSMAIGKTQNIMQMNLIFITINFSLIEHTITTLKSRNMSVIDSMIVCKLTNQQ